MTCTIAPGVTTANSSTVHAFYSNNGSDSNCVTSAAFWITVQAEIVISNTTCVAAQIGPSQTTVYALAQCSQQPPLHSSAAPHTRISWLSLTLLASALTVACI